MIGVEVAWGHVKEYMAGFSSADRDLPLEEVIVRARGRELV